MEAPVTEEAFFRTITYVSLKRIACTIVYKSVSLYLENDQCIASLIQ